MLNREKHQLIMGQILKDIYTNISIGSLLGFKGGTCAYFFYHLPRFSVDLDFDLLEVNSINQALVFENIISILGSYGAIKDKYIKRNTIFALLSYGNTDHNIKVEISIRKLAGNIRDKYEILRYLGISMLVGKKDSLFANKLCALTLRKETAMRDVYDIYYFAKNNWDINAEVINNQVGKSTKEYLPCCISHIEKINNARILQGLGEVVEGEKEKAWIRAHLKNETLFLLRNYLSVLK